MVAFHFYALIGPLAGNSILCIEIPVDLYLLTYTGDPTQVGLRPEEVIMYYNCKVVNFSIFVTIIFIWYSLSENKRKN